MLEGAGYAPSPSKDLTVLRLGAGLVTQRPQSSSFWGLPYRILNMNPQKELLWGRWVGLMGMS